MDKPPGTRVIVLDDDPTGSQCASGVTVDLRPATGSAEEGADSRFVLTNTRAMDADSAVDLVRDVMAKYRGSAPRIVPILRGDSTLRGHVVAEMEALGLSEKVGLMVPAYPSAGRATLGGVHCLMVDERPVNVADTEFARDPVFGFSSRNMSDYWHEAGGAGPVTLVPLESLRSQGPAAIVDALDAAPHGGVVIPDVTSDADIAAVASAYWAYAASGQEVVVRCSAPLAAELAGVPGRLLAAGPRQDDRVLVVCGSHTAAASRQIAALETIAPVRLVRKAYWEASHSSWRSTLAGMLLADMDERGVAVIATERVRDVHDNSLAHGARVMDALVSLVAVLAPHVGSVISKGGITSAEVAVNGLGGVSAIVRGQILTGVSWWDVQAESRPPRVQIVVPGNVGGDDTLLNAIAFLRPLPRTFRG